MNLRELECFLAVAGDLHFGHAADRLHLAQPTVSEAIQRLERQLGGNLFDRSTRNVSLTEFGLAFLDEATEAYERVVAAYETGRMLASRRRDQFVIGATSDEEEVLVAGVAALRHDRPGITVIVEEMTASRQVDALRQRCIDVGVALMPPTGEGIASLTIGMVGYVAIVQDASPLAGLKAVSLSRLAAEPLITWPRDTNPLLYDRFTGAMNAAGVPWSLAATATCVANLASRVMSGQGVGVVPGTAVASRPFKGLTYLPLGADGPVVDRTLLWHRQAQHLLLPTFIRIVRRLWRGSGFPMEKAAG
jgi:DNA-binding transcriptional LysR family regulator